MSRLWAEGKTVSVVVDEGGLPTVLTWDGRAHQVQAIAKSWRVDQDWWRGRTWREYYKLTTQTGLLLLVYRDLLSGQWYLQRLYD